MTGAVELIMVHVVMERWDKMSDTPFDPNSAAGKKFDTNRKVGGTRLINALRAATFAHPDERVGQIIINAVSKGRMSNYAMDDVLFYIENDDLAAMVEEYSTTKR
jgi:hypothetical protein